jgi:hypothetical protein
MGINAPRAADEEDDHSRSTNRIPIRLYGLQFARKGRVLKPNETARNPKQSSTRHYFPLELAMESRLLTSRSFSLLGQLNGMGGQKLEVPWPLIFRKNGCARRFIPIVA